MYEVELKFPLIDAEPVIRRLAQLGAEPGAPQQQTDFYFNHPARDFEHTDEALRIRCEQAVRNHDPCISCATHFLKLDVVRG